MKKVLLGVLLIGAGILQGQSIKPIDVQPDGIYIKEFRKISKAEKAFRKGIVKENYYDPDGKVKGIQQ